MLENIKVLCHNCIRFEKEKIIYTDPFKLKKNYNDADIILITHSHYDHFSEEDIMKVKKEKTMICISDDLYDRTLELGFEKKNIITVSPNNKYEILGIKITTTPAYNISKQFHPKENRWIGYLIHLNNIVYYVAGDTDITKENKNVKCDVAFVPVGGTYTMNSSEAAELINIIKPKVAIPVHYGCIVGTEKDANDFIYNLDKKIKGKILYK